MEKRNVYKAKSVCQPVMGVDSALIADAAKREKAYQDSLKTLSRRALAHDGGTVKALYYKSEHGNVNIGGK